MAVFLLKTLEGSAYVPPVGTGIFDDVPLPESEFADCIEELYNRRHHRRLPGDSACSTARQTRCYRGQMAVFLVKTFGLLLLYGTVSSRDTDPLRPGISLFVIGTSLDPCGAEMIRH